MANTSPLRGNKLVTSKSNVLVVQQKHQEKEVQHQRQKKVYINSSKLWMASISNTGGGGGGGDYKDSGGNITIQIGSLQSKLTLKLRSNSWQISLWES